MASKLEKEERQANLIRARREIFGSGSTTVKSESDSDNDLSSWNPRAETENLESGSCIVTRLKEAEQKGDVQLYLSIFHGLLRPAVEECVQLLQ